MYYIVFDIDQLYLTGGIGGRSLKLSTNIIIIERLSRPLLIGALS